MALPSDITLRIRQNLIVETDPYDGKDSFYINFDNTIVRVSNHCTYLWTWDARYRNHNNKNYVSIVFEDTNTFSGDNLLLKRRRKNPLIVDEYVYKITDANSFNSMDVKKVIRSIKNMDKGYNTQYIDETGKLTGHYIRKSINPMSEIKEDFNKLNCIDEFIHKSIINSLFQILKN
jgi:hypothetical protein